MKYRSMVALLPASCKCHRTEVFALTMLAMKNIYENEDSEVQDHIVQNQVHVPSPIQNLGFKDNEIQKYN